MLKAAREKQQVTYKGNPICLTSDLSAETVQARRGWQNIFKVLKGKNLQPRLLYTARISFKIGGEIKRFPDKQKLREFSTPNQLYNKCYRDLHSQEIQEKKKIYPKQLRKVNPKQLRKQ